MCRRGRASPSSPPRSRCCPQQQRAVKARHKDQWEGDPALQRAIAAATARLGDGGPRPRPAVRHGARAAGDGRRARTRRWSLELADSLAALAGERLN